MNNEKYIHDFYKKILLLITRMKYLHEIASLLLIAVTILKDS